MSRLIFGLLLTVTLAGCVTSAAVDYLTLTSLPQDVTRSDAASVSVGPITLPDYLKRNSLATRDDAGALHYSATELWAEPLDRGIQRTLVEVLSDALGDTPVLSFPEASSITATYRITVSVRRLAASDSKASMTATWRILPASRTAAAPALTGSFSRSEALTSPSGPGIARAFSELVHALALEIAVAVPSQDG